MSFISPIVWKDTGEIISVPDLAGSTMIIDWANLFDRSFALKCIWLEVSSGRFLDISGDELEKVSEPGYNLGANLYVFTFPKDLKNLSAACTDYHPS